MSYREAEQKAAPSYPPVARPTQGPLRDIEGGLGIPKIGSEEPQGP